MEIRVARRLFHRRIFLTASRRLRLRKWQFQPADPDGACCAIQVRPNDVSGWQLDRTTPRPFRLWWKHCD